MGVPLGRPSPLPGAQVYLAAARFESASGRARFAPKLFDDENCCRFVFGCCWSGLESRLSALGARSHHHQRALGSVVAEGQSRSADGCRERGCLRAGSHRAERARVMMIDI